jgi:hypothetical protein
VLHKYLAPSNWKAFQILPRLLALPNWRALHELQNNFGDMVPFSATTLPNVVEMANFFGDITQLFSMWQLSLGQ